MSQLLTTRVVTITEMRQPHKVLEEAEGKPVAVLRNSQCVGYFVPAESVEQFQTMSVPRAKLLQSLEETAEQAEPVLGYLQDK